MSIVSGSLVPYLSYREKFKPKKLTPIHWSWKNLLWQLEEFQRHHSQRGSLTFSTLNNEEGCEILPGSAISIQVIKPLCRTQPHKHSWWHLFIVQQGKGSMILDGNNTLLIKQQDVLLVPAWCLHEIVNDSSEENLILMSLTNLPQQSALGCLFESESTNEINQEFGGRHVSISQ